MSPVYYINELTVSHFTIASVMVAAPLLRSYPGDSAYTRLAVVVALPSVSGIFSRFESPQYGAGLYSPDYRVLLVVVPNAALHLKSVAAPP